MKKLSLGILICMATVLHGSRGMYTTVKQAKHNHDRQQRRSERKNDPQVLVTKVATLRKEIAKVAAQKQYLLQDRSWTLCSKYDRLARLDVRTAQLQRSLQKTQRRLGIN